MAVLGKGLVRCTIEGGAFAGGSNPVRGAGWISRAAAQGGAAGTFGQGSSASPPTCMQSQSATCDADRGTSPPQEPVRRCTGATPRRPLCAEACQSAPHRDVCSITPKFGENRPMPLNGNSRGTPEGDWIDILALSRLFCHGQDSHANALLRCASQPTFLIRQTVEPSTHVWANRCKGL